MENQVGKSELRIEKKDNYGFRIEIDGKSYFIKDEGNGWFNLVVENEEREAVDVIPDRYENLGTRDLSDLIGKLVANPNEVLELLLGEKKNVENIVIKF